MASKPAPAGLFGSETWKTCHEDACEWEHPSVTESWPTATSPWLNHEKLLKIAIPRLCEQCHVESRHPTRAQGHQTRSVFNRPCTTCHSEVHGSNHPSHRSSAPSEACS